ncbi:hypothetical protein SAMN05428959_10348 [Duganella sp. CF517]|nr:hypothetical protein SAMN05428959_10348 [Duganella sp. CF517]
MGERALTQPGPGEAASMQLHTAPSASAPIQRAVGFEFQTYQSGTLVQIDTANEASSSDSTSSSSSDHADAEEKKEDTSAAAVVNTSTQARMPSHWEPYNKDNEERYAEGNGVKVEKDGQDLEFVTNAFPESDAGRAALTLAIRTVVLTALGLEGGVLPTPLLPMLGTGLSAAPHARDTVRIASEGNMTASAQATAGVSLARVNELLSLLGRAKPRQTNTNLASIFNKENARPGERDYKAGATLERSLAAEAGNNDTNTTQKKLVGFAYPFAEGFVKKHFGNEDARLKGVVHLIALYVFGRNTKAVYAKARTPVMSRSNLADVVLSLPKDQQDRFTKMIPHLQSALGVAANTSAANLLYKHVPPGDTVATGIGEAESAQITIKSWLEGLPQGHDAMERFEGFAIIANQNKVDHASPNDPEYFKQKWFSAEYGAGLDSSTDIGTRELSSDVGETAHRVDGIILEMRNLGNDSLDISEWPSFALSFFDLILLVNAASEEEKNAMAQAMHEQRSFETDLGDQPVRGVFAQARDILAGGQ